MSNIKKDEKRKSPLGGKYVQKSEQKKSEQKKDKKSSSNCC